MFKSLYDEIKEEGRAEGRAEARAELLSNKRAMAEKCLKLGMSIATTADLADLPEAEVREIAKALG